MAKTSADPGVVREVGSQDQGFGMGRLKPSDPAKVFKGGASPGKPPKVKKI